MLSLLRAVADHRPRLRLPSIVPVVSRQARQLVLDLALRLLRALARRVRRLLPAGTRPDAPALGAARWNRPEIQVRVEPIVEPDPIPKRPDPTGWVAGFLAGIQRPSAAKDRVLNQTLVDLERLIAVLQELPTPLDTEGLVRSFHQLQRIADPDAGCNEFELNMAWMLLEREVRSVVERIPN
jgi:hypothetical protein